MMSCRQSQTSPKTEFTTIFSKAFFPKCKASSMATGRLEGASGLRLDQPGRRWVGKGGEGCTCAASPSACTRLATWENGARPTDEPPTPPACEGAEAGACDPAPGDGAVLRQAASKPGLSLKSAQRYPYLSLLYPELYRLETIEGHPWISHYKNLILAYPKTTFLSRLIPGCPWIGHCYRSGYPGISLYKSGFGRVSFFSMDCSAAALALGCGSGPVAEVQPALGLGVASYFDSVAWRG